MSLFRFVKYLELFLELLLAIIVQNIEINVSACCVSKFRSDKTGVKLFNLHLCFKIVNEFELVNRHIT